MSFSLVEDVCPTPSLGPDRTVRGVREGRGLGQSQRGGRLCGVLYCGVTEVLSHAGHHAGFALGARRAGSRAGHEEAKMVQVEFANPSVVSPDKGGCPACDHDLERHDAIGRRFCDATLAHALQRGCICRLV